MTSAPPAVPTTSSRPRGEVVGLAVLLSVVSVLAGLVLGWAVFGRGGFPLDNSAEAGFARDMQTHHGQAVQMSLLIMERTDDPAVRIFASDIATSQQGQAGQMFAWLQLWGLTPTGSEPSMAWMGDDHHSASGGGVGSGSGSGSGSADAVAMPGMATPTDITALTAAKGVAADRIFLTLMIAHHRGGVEMADAVLARSDRKEVVILARAMKSAQTSEINAMQQMLDAKA